MSKKGGRPRHKKDEVTSAKVQAIAAFKVPHADIAIYLGISLPTLYRYYKPELDHGRIGGLVKTFGKLFQAIDRGEAWAICFHLKTIGGLRESSIVQNQTLDANGQPINPVAPQMNVSFANGGPGRPRVSTTNNPYDRDAIFATPAEETSTPTDDGGSVH